MEATAEPRRLLIVEDDDAFARTLARSFERFGRASLHDRRSNLLRFRLIAQLAKRGSQVAGRKGIQQLGCRAAPRRVHAHIERAIAREREAALGIIHLHARHAEIGQQTIAALQSEATEHAW